MQSSDKLLVEIFPEPEQESERVRTILEHLISPGQDVGGDSRLLIPTNKNVVTAEKQIGGQVSQDSTSPTHTMASEANEEICYVVLSPLMLHLAAVSGLFRIRNDIAGTADLHVHDLSIRDNYQKRLSDQAKELCSCSDTQGHCILLCCKVSCPYSCCSAICFLQGPALLQAQLNTSHSNQQIGTEMPHVKLSCTERLLLGCA